VAYEKGANLGQTPHGTYQAIAQTLRERIERGDYPARSRLPGEPELMNEFGVARATVRRAISSLAEAGLINTVHGVGSFVSDGLANAPSLPRHAQISSEIRDQIDTGRLSPGEQLPSEAELQARFDASRTTVRRALKTLEDAGLVEIARGKRRTVSAPSD